MHRRVLIVEDQEINRIFLHTILEEDYEVLEAENGVEALAVLQKEYRTISAIILDLVMPEMDGFEVLFRMHQNADFAQIPVIVATATDDSQAEEKALQAGAIDYVSKPYSPNILKNRLWNTINLREQAAIVNATRRDALTGLLSRAAFFERAGELIGEHEAGFYIMACFDIVNFKLINDRYGSNRGDQVLRKIAAILKEGFTGAGGITARIMADNFAVLYPKDFMNSVEIAEIRTKLMTPDEQMAAVNFSIGRYIVEDTTLEPSAMYDRAVIAKECIKGRFDENYSVFNETMRNRILTEQDIINDMQEALDHCQFEVWYQPQYNHLTGSLIGAEALVRWRHPVKGLISPGVFIPIFEANGFVYEVDKYVWEQACIFLKRMKDEGKTVIPVSVNISRYDIFREDLIDYIQKLVEKYEIQPEDLRLEITESAFAKSGEQIIHVVKQLKELGFTIEIDDFGSGYSSLNTLKDVPADVLKLDMRFLEGAENADKGGNILESMVRMARWIGMSVIAEGVEKIEQADFMKSIGCNYIQGYLYSKPIPAYEYERILMDESYAERMSNIEDESLFNSDAFWNPESMDTVIFNSFVGGACIFEYHNGRIEIVRANDKYARILSGKKILSKDAMKINWEHHLTANSQEKVYKAISEAIKTGMEITDEMELQNFRGKGKSAYLRSNMRVIANAGDRYLFYCVLEDMTEQRIAEINQRRLATQLGIILKNMNGGISASACQEDGTMELKYANELFYEQRGYSKGQYEDEVKNMLDLVYPEDAEKIRQLQQEVQVPDTSFSVTYRIIKRDGSVRWMNNKISVNMIEDYAFPIQIAVTDDITAEHEAVAKAREKDTLLKIILNNVGSGITAVILGTERVKYLFANEQYFSILGYTQEQYNTEIDDDYAVIQLEDRKRIYEGVHGIQVLNQPVIFEYRIVTREGVIKDIRMVTSNTQMEDSDKIIQLSVYSDITEEKRKEENRKALIENLPCGAGIFDIVNGVVKSVYQNRRYWKLVGRKEEKEKKDSVMDFVSLEDRSYLAIIIQKMILSGKEQECEIHIMHGDGHYIPMVIRGSVVKQKTGKVSLYVTYTPITENALTFRQMLPVALETMMASSSDLFFIKDRSLHYVCASHAFAEILGFSDEKDIIGKTDYDLFNKKDADRFRKTDEQLLETGESLIDYVEELPSKTIVKRYSSTSKYLLHDSTGNVIGIYGVSRDITENKGAFERLKMLTDSIPGGIGTYQISKQGVKNIFLSEGIFELTGYTKDDYDINNYDPMTFILEEDRNMMRTSMEKLISGEREINCYYRVNRKDRELRWVNLRGRVTEKTEDTVTINTVMFDVTKQMITRLKLEEVEQESRKQYEHELQLRKGLMKDSVFYYQLNLSTGIIEEFEPEKEMSLLHAGVRLNEDIRAEILSNIYPEDAQSVRDILFFDGLKKAYEKGERNVSLTYRRKLSDDNYYWVKSDVFMTEKPDSEEVIAFLHCRNIDDVRKAQLAIETIFDEDIEAVIYINIHQGTARIAHMLESLNHNGLHDVFNFKEEFDKYCDALVAEEEKASYKEFFTTENMMKRLEENKLVTYVYHMYESGNSYRKLIKMYYMDHSKEVIVLSLRDITDFYEAEQARQRSLQEAVDKATRASQAKSEFLSNMSHDIRTPLNAVLAFSNKELVEGADESRLMDYMSKINSSGEYLLGIMNDVLDMSRIEQNRMILNPEPYSLEELEETIHNVLDDMFSKRKINLMIDFSRAGQKDILVDRTRFNQIFINLLSNAAKFTKRGGQVELIAQECEAVDDSKKTKMKFVVRDNGIGMSEEFATHAFDSFSQEYRKEASERNKGTGLGLSIVKELVSMMGGEIQLESELNKGTTFVIHLPIEKKHGKETKEKPIPADLGKLKGSHILVVEDNDINMEIEKALLEKYGCIIDGAENGEVACEIFKESDINYYQFILMDIRMPVMDGLTATKKIRSMKRSDAKTVPIIAMTADAFNKDEATSYSVGMNAYLAKPIRPEQLYSICCNFLT